MGNKSKGRGRKRKRAYRGNQHKIQEVSQEVTAEEIALVEENEPEDDLVVAQASSSDDGDDGEATDSSSSDTESDSEEDTHVTRELTGNRIIDISCLDELLSEVAVCSNCRKGQLTLQESECVGLVPMWILECDTCNVRTEMAMGKKPDQAKFFDINRRSTLAMRLVGRGRDALDKICAVLDLPGPVANSMSLSLSRRPNGRCHAALLATLVASSSSSSTAITTTFTTTA
eukprot:scpid90255/ scgid25761/ 